MEDIDQELPYYKLPIIKIKQMKSRQSKDRQKGRKGTGRGGQNAGSLTNKIIEWQLRQNNDEYQHLLIRCKELELELLEEENINKQMMKDFARKKNGVQIMKSELQKVKNQCEKKKVYLQQYYSYLDKKLKSGSPANINMFTNLQRYSKGLKEKQNKEQDNLESDVKTLQIQAQKLREEFQMIEESKNKIVEEYEERKVKKEGEIAQRKQIKIELRKAKEKQMGEYMQLQKNIEKIRRQRQNLEKEEAKLKKLLNVEEEHKRYWLKIENGVKKQFVGKMKQERYKQAIGKEYEMKIPEYKSLLNQRKFQKEVLVQELDERKKHLDEIKTNMNESLIKYSQLEGDMMSSSNKKKNGQ